MTLKIIILKQNILDQNVLLKGLNIAEAWAETIGLSILFEEHDTTKQFTSVPVSNNAIGNGYVVNGTEIFQEAKLISPVFDIACLVYDWTKITPKPTNPAENGMSISIPCQWYMQYPEVFAEFLLHEICHYFFTKENITDITHNYDPRFSQKQRYEWYLFLLKSFVSKPIELPKVTLSRFSDDGVQTLGDLKIGSFACKTLERPWRFNNKNISCIPKGVYDVRWTFSWKFMKYTYEILNVPNRAGIRFHSGNFFYDVEGCIILGDKYGDINHDKWADLMNSRVTLKAFEDYMDRKPFKLEIL